MAAVALLKDKPQPTDADIDDGITNICRCGTYPRIRAAIHRAAELAKQEGLNLAAPRDTPAKQEGH
jgi:isoquinoline 1-oxidoreductase alpha subunit